MSHILILGNSGAGKTTLARDLAEARDLAHLDLDTLVWGEVAVERPHADTSRDLAAFCAAHDRWVIEGSYADWAEHLSPLADALVLLNPGVAVCLAHQRARPWEPHKYDDPSEQERRRAFLETWTAQYPTRNDRYGLTAHRRALASFRGPTLEAVDADQALRWLAGL